MPDNTEQSSYTAVNSRQNICDELTKFDILNLKRKDPSILKKKNQDDENWKNQSIDNIIGVTNKDM